MVQVMACHLFGAKPLSEPMLTICQLVTWEQTSLKFQSKYKHFRSRKYIWKCCQKMAVILSRCQCVNATEMVPEANFSILCLMQISCIHLHTRIDLIWNMDPGSKTLMCLYFMGYTLYALTLNPLHAKILKRNLNMCNFYHSSTVT